MYTLCAIAKDEGVYLKEWVEYHQAIGFEKVVIYDNGSEPSVQATLGSELAGVTVRFWPTTAGVAPQVQAYADCLLKDSQTSRWMMFLDIDEFLNLKLDGSVQSFVGRYPQADAIAVNWRMFGSSGKLSREPGLVTHRFRMASAPHHSTNAHVKTIFDPRKVVDACVHVPSLVPGGTLLSASGRTLPPLPDLLVHDIDTEVAQINHYFVKSLEEFHRKRARGRGDIAVGQEGKYRNEADFEAEDRNEVLDQSILRWWPLDGSSGRSLTRELVSGADAQPRD